jgi:HlyD family secretion protein
METSIFRKTSLERLSSPEQLDTIMRVTGAKRWLALAEMFLILGVVAIWGYAGTIDTKVGGSGVIVRTGTVLNVVTGGAGLVTGVNVELGDRVKADQVVATVSGGEM